MHSLLVCISELSATNHAPDFYSASTDHRAVFAPSAYEDLGAAVGHKEKQREKLGDCNVVVRFGPSRAVPGSHQLQRDAPDACPAHRRRKARDLQAQKFEGGGSSSADVYCVVSASLPLPR